MLNENPTLKPNPPPGEHVIFAFSTGESVVLYVPECDDIENAQRHIEFSTEIKRRKDADLNTTGVVRVVSRES